MFGLRYYRGLELKRAIFTGLIIQVLECIGGSAVTGALLSSGFQQDQANVWGLIVACVPGVLCGLAIIDRAFRGIKFWTSYLLSYAVACSGPVWLFRGARINANEMYLLITAVVMLWIGVMGYWMLRARFLAEPKGDLRAAGAGALAPA